ncbi:MAG TPA: hypothetical protein VFE47_17870 [Tepidisphaeraceae bacterium]|jgi:tetratricopeptide (TPR) repeat protein|nr:hypothetical protein [Tepidisphaeraceae bacterium]
MGRRRGQILTGCVLRPFFCSNALDLLVYIADKKAMRLLRVNRWLVIALLFAAVIVTSAVWSWRIYRSTHFSFEGRLDKSKPAERLISLALIEWRQIPVQDRATAGFDSRESALSAIAVALVAIDETDSALEIAKTTVGSDFYSGYACIAGKLVHDGRDDDAKAIARLSADHDNNPNLWVWWAIIHAQARRGDFASAKASIESLHQPASSDGNWLEVVRGSCAARYFGPASEAIAEIHEPQTRLTAFAFLASAQLDASDQDGAAKSIALALAECPNIPERRRLSSGEALAQVLARVGRVDEARQVISNYGKDVGQDVIIRGLAEGGKFAVALKLADELRSDDSYRDIASAQIKLGDFKAARATAEKLETLSKRAGILAEIAQAELSAGDQAGALNDVRDAREILLGEHNTALDKQSYRPDPRVFGKLAGIEVEAGIADEAIDRIKDASTDPQFRSEAYAAAAKEVARK